ncbi:MAG: response regulator [Chloroflexi bacterium]|nr:response regulator [Chloroflexota bacterium]
MNATVPVHHASLGLDELRAEAVRAIVFGLLAMAAFIFGLIAVDPGRWHQEPMPVLAGLALTAVATGGLLSRGVVPSTLALLVGLAGTIAAATYAFGNGLFVTAYPAVAIVAGMLLGWRYAAVAGVASGAIILALKGYLPGVVSADVADVALLLTVVNLSLSWLLSRPVGAALDWSWASYAQAREKTEEARTRQAELARLSKSLEEACHRLEVANEELERARKAAVDARLLKAEFAATISHELRTPLNLIIGFSEMMVMNPETYGGVSLPTSYRGDVEAIYRNACHLSSLVDDILDLAKIEARRMGLQREQSRLDQVVGEAVAAIQTMFLDRGLALEVRLPPDLPGVYADRTRVRQILMNLLSNAVRFTSSGGVTVGGACDGQDIVVWVTDTGTGIPAADLAHIFDEFYQVTGPNWRRNTGLGLTISKRFVELHGGSMWAESKYGEGATFYFSLPLSANVVAVPARDDWQTWVHAPTRGTATPTVAVLDDDPEVVSVFQRYLDGYQVVSASTMHQADRSIDSRPVRALIATAEAGGETVRVPIAAHGLANLPTVVCPLRSSRSISRDLGVVQYLTKPITREQLRAVIHRLGKGIRDVLVVDDDPEMVRLLARMVQSGRRARDRREVRAAADGAGALQAMRERRPDLVLLDLLMPGIDGYGVLEQMRGDEQLRNVPVVLVTARGINERMVASELKISRPCGLSVGEVMRCLEASLNVLLETPDEHNAPALPAAPGE